MALRLSVLRIDRRIYTTPLALQNHQSTGDIHARPPKERLFNWSSLDLKEATISSQKYYELDFPTGPSASCSRRAFHGAAAVHICYPVKEY